MLYIWPLEQRYDGLHSSRFVITQQYAALLYTVLLKNDDLYGFRVIRVIRKNVGP